MFNISSFLSKLSKNVNSLELNVEKIVGVIEKQTAIKLSVNNIEFKNSTIYIVSSPAVKNKIFIFKNSIIEELEKEMSVKILDIR